MSAETEQYREQLGKTFWRGTASHFGDPSDWDNALPNEKEVIADGAMAVAAQVLRDFKAFIGWRASRNMLDPTQDLRCIGHLDAFARDRGIDLEGGTT